MKVPGWDCADGTPDEDHDWKVIHDWAGDPGVINGTYDIRYMKCEQCGKEKDCPANYTEPDYYEDDIL